MAAYSDILYGKIALKNQLITPAQLQQALAAMGQRRGMSLAEALVREGFLSPRKARRVQKAQALSQFVRAERLFARIALERGLSDVPTLQACFQRQQALGYRARLGQLLQELGRISADEHESIVEEQLLRLAEDTARMEEAGFGDEPAAPPADVESRRLEEMSEIGAATDLEGSVLRRAVGPRGMLRREAIDRSLPAFVVPRLDEPRARAEPDAWDDVEIDDEDDPLAGSNGRQEALRAPAPPAGPIDPGNLVGATIASRYRVEAKVGEGGMGTVYRAQHCLMEKTVALKVLHPSLVDSQLSLERFRQEIRAASRFQHKNVVQIYDAGQGEGGLFYMAMEFAEGVTLEHLLEQGPLPLPRVLRILRQVLAGVAEAHQKGIVHRDLKSGNIMIVADKATPDLVKVMDFGLAKIALDSSEGPLSRERGEPLHKTQEGMVTGTPAYMSPEQCAGEPVDKRSDLYSLGVVLFELLTGQLPFHSHTAMGYLGKHIVEPPPRPGEVAPQRAIPRALEELTLRLLAKRPDQRPQSAEEVLRALDAAEGIESPREPTPRAGVTTDRAAPTPERPAATRAGTSDRTAARTAEKAAEKAAEKGKSAGSGRAARPSQRAPRVNGSDRHPPASPERSERPGARTGGSSQRHRSLPANTPLARTSLAPAPFAGAPLASTEAAPAPVAAPAPARGRPWGLLVGLFGLLIVTASASVWLALGSRGQLPAAQTGSAAQVLGEAGACLERGDPAAALALLDPLVAADPANDAARALQDQASRERERLSLIAEADRLANEYRAGTSARAGAERALTLYADALARRDDPRVRARRDALRGALTRPADQPGPQDPLAQRRAALDAALEKGDLREARRLFEAFGGQLGQNQPVYQSHLEAEEKLAEARGLLEAGRKGLARQRLDEARQLHPVRARRQEIERELARLDDEREREGERQAALEALEGARTAALTLDRARLDAALRQLRALLEQLPVAETEPTRRLAEALAGAAPLLEDVRGLRAELDRLQRLDPIPRLESSAAEERARVLCERARGLGDPELATRLCALLETDAARASDLAAKARSGPEPAPAQQDAQRFAAAVEKARAQPRPERESAQSVLDDLQRVSELQAYPGYESGAPADKAWVDGELARLVDRQKVWNELGPDFVLIPGGRWESPVDPSGEKREWDLPAVYYAATAEVTCAEWNGFMRATGSPRPQSFPGPTGEPVTGITLKEARRYCEWRSKGSKRVQFRLPSEGEWERAARASAGTEYPWGDVFEPWRANDVALTKLARVRSHPKDQNAWGLFDLVGNALELTTSTRAGGMIVLKGGGVGVSRKDAGASAVALVREGGEAAPNVGLRLFAQER